MMFKKCDRQKVAVALLVVAVAAAVGGIASFSAKYAHSEGKDAATASEAFYFTSDVLTSDGKASYDLPAGTTSISFELRNYADDLRWSDSDIEYTWKLAGAADKSGSGSIARSGSAGSKSTVRVDGLGAGTYTVTATATAPYKQVLSATFKIASTDMKVGSTVQDSAGSPTATLVVSTQDYAGDVTVKWPAGVVPDTTQDAFKDVIAGADGTDGGSVTVAVDSFSSYSFRFFKTETGVDYSDGSRISAAAQ